MNSMILRNLSYGMYAIGVKGKERPSACIVNTVVQITSQHPPIIAVSMNHYNYSHQCIEENGIFTVSVLSEDTSSIAGRRSCSQRKYLLLVFMQSSQ